LGRCRTEEFNSVADMTAIKPIPHPVAVDKNSASDTVIYPWGWRPDNEL
jgi:hypothetical protein